MALNHEKKVRNLYPLLVFYFLYRNLSPPTAMAVIKGVSNAPGGFGFCPI